MKYDFDEIIDRKNTDSVKHDFAIKMGYPEDILPLWVADMDFRTPDCVIDALVDKSRYGVFGYTESGDDYFEALQAWFSKRFNWDIGHDWLVKAPGVVYAINVAMRALTDIGDSVLIQQPVYYPFAESIEMNNRKLVVSELIYSDGKYLIDFDDFEEKIIQNKVALFILCSPHNPVGRVWTKDELMHLGDICIKHNVKVVSDEIHADFIFPGHSHTVFASLKHELADITVTCTAPTKTFNLAALQISNIFISNPEARLLFRRELARSGCSQTNVMGMAACKAAYKYGQEWLEELNKYLAANLDFLRSFLKDRLPRVKLVEPEGTYLIWLDFRDFGFSSDELEDLIVKKASLWLDAGTMFGAGGEGFERVNIACPRKILERALLQLEGAVAQLNK